MSRRHPPVRRAQEEAEDEARAVKEWNAKHPVGTEVLLWLDLGEEIVTRTTTPAWLFTSRCAVVRMEGVRAPYPLSRVSAVS